MTPKRKLTLLFACFCFILLLGLFLLNLYKINAGSKVIKDPVENAQKIYEFCSKQNQSLERCYTSQFYALTRENNLDYSIKTLTGLQDLDPSSRGCHLISHKIASAEVQKNPSNWINLLEKVNPYFCTGGFLHGVIEAHMGSDSSFVISANQIETICSKVKEKSYGQKSCYHSLGHLLLLQEEQNIPSSIEICNKVKDQVGSYECLSGVFMENITRENLIDHKLAERIPWDVPHTKQVEELCKKQSGQAAKACWKEISYMYITIGDNKPANLYKLCKNAPTKEMQDECYIYGVGNMVVFNSFSTLQLENVCNEYSNKDPLLKTCIYQVIGSMMASSSKYLNQAQAVCNKTEGQLEKDCNQRLEGLYNNSASNSPIRSE